MTKKAYFLNGNLSGIRSGIEESAMKRTFYFKEQLQLATVFVTVNYNPQLQTIFEKLKQQGKIEKGTELLNLYRFYQGNRDDKKLLLNQKRDNFNIVDRQLIIEQVPSTKDYRILNNQQQIIIYNKRDDNGRTLYNNHFAYNPNKEMYRRDYFDTFTGCLSKTQHVEDGHTKFETYYTLSGKPCIYKTFKMNDNKSVLHLIELLDEQLNVKATFHTEGEFILYWIKEYFSKLSELETVYLVVDHAKIYSESLAVIRKPNLKTIFLMHSSHIVAGAPPETGAINRNYGYLLENPSIADGIVTFTGRQKRHMQERLGMWNHIRVIPHNLAHLPEQVPFEGRVKNQIVYLARFSVLKHQEALIRAFQQVVKEIPDATLHLYGEGETKLKNQEYVQNNGLEKSIFIHPFTSEVTRIYNDASLAVSPSKLEGFSLFILESISHGLPVVSFDIDYGPSDMIENGVNGLLVPPLDETKLAEGIIKILKDPVQHRRMSEAAYQSAKRFTASQISELWRNMIESI